MPKLRDVKIGGQAKFLSLAETKDRIIIKLAHNNSSLKDKSMELALNKELLLSELYYEIDDDKYNEMIKLMSQGKNILDAEIITALLHVLDGSKLDWMFDK